MAVSREEYFKALDIDPSQRSKDSPLANALARAYALRDFEIEHYWKRATYFWGFQVAIFAAFGLLFKNGISSEFAPITIALSWLGFLTALASVFSFRGSSFGRGIGNITSTCSKTISKGDCTKPFGRAGEGRASRYRKSITRSVFASRSSGFSAPSTSLCLMERRNGSRLPFLRRATSPWASQVWE